MKSRHIFALAICSALNTLGQVNESVPERSFWRAQSMLESHNYQGCIDQLELLSKYEDPNLDYAEVLWMRAKALAVLNRDEARGLMAEFIARYPGSVHRVEALLELASFSFYDGHYETALHKFNDIDAGALTDYEADDLYYRMAFCQLKTGDYQAAEHNFVILEKSKRYANAALFYRGYIAYVQADYARAVELFGQVNTGEAPGNMADYYLTQIYFKDGDYGKAMQMAQKVLRHTGIEPQFRAEANRVAGESAFNLGRENDALSYLNTYYESVDNPLPSALYILGVIDYRNGLYQKAIDMLSRVVDEDNAMGQSASLFLGQAYLKEGNNAAALMALQRATRMEFDLQVQETAFYNYAVARLSGARIPFGSSVSTFEEFLQRFPSSRYAAQVQEYVVNGYITDNDYAAALKSIERIKNPSPAVLAAKQRVLFVLGTRSFSTGQYAEAAQQLMQSLQLASHNSEIAAESYLWLGDCYYRMGRYKQAEQAYRNYLGRASRAAENRPLATYDLGYALFAQRSYTDSRKQFEAAVGIRPQLDNATLADAYNRIADTYYYQSDFSKAGKNYDRAYEINPEAGDYAMFQKAMMRGLSRDFSGKLSAIDNMVEQFPSSSLVASALLEKAETYIALNDQDAAIRTYKMVMERFPSTSQGRNAMLQLAITYRNIGDVTNAEDAYRNVVSTYPSSDEASIAADDMKVIYSEQDRLEELDAYLSSIPDAPQLGQAEKNSMAARQLYRKAIQAQSEGDNKEALETVTRLLKQYPDVDVAEDALAMKADIEYGQGKTEMALADYKKLQEHASDAVMLRRARLGTLRSARDMGQHDLVVETADRILASSAVGGDERNEILFIRAAAYNGLGRATDAEKEWSRLASNTDNIYGCMSAYNLADRQFRTGRVDDALLTVNAFIDANPPHSYWLARGFILLSDILRAQGNEFEANEYLRSLKSNYPGSEVDIFEMISSRLNE